MPDIFGPPSSGWGAPKVDFSWLSQLPNDFYKGAQDKQNYDLSRAFQGGLPTDANGMPDYRAVMAKLAQMGDINAISALSQPALQQSQTQQAQQLSPLLSPGAPAAAGAPAPTAAPQAGAMPAPQLIPASSLPADIPPASAAGAQRTTGAATVDELVASVAPGGKGKTVAANVAKALKVSPDAPLTPEQVERARRLVSGYAQRTGVELPGSGLLARGLRNANPTNIEAGPFAASQPGYVGSDGRFAKFATPEQGIQAAATLLSRYGKGGINTVDKIIAKWAPSSDGNNVANYSKFVAKQIGVEPNQPLDMKDPQTLLKLAGAMSEFENGTKGAAPSAPASHAIIPQVPLPADPRTGKQFTDPQQAILAIDQEMARLSVNPRAAGQVAALKDYRDRIAAQSQPLEVRPGETLLDPGTGRTIFQAPGINPAGAGNLVNLENTERAQRGLPPMTAQEEIAFIQRIHPQRSAPAMAVEQFKQDFQQQNGRDPTAEEITKFSSNYAREQSYGRTAGGQGARVENAANEVVQLIPQALEASRTVPRGKWVPFNQLVQKWDQGSSDPAYNDFMMANFSLLNAYTRAMNPQGVPRIQERLEQHALGVLSTATDEKSYEVQIRRLWKEVQASKTATAETAKGVTPGNINAPVPGLDTPAATATKLGGGIPASAIHPGDVLQGYRFKGGDPSDKTNWEKT